MAYTSEDESSNGSDASSILSIPTDKLKVVFEIIDTEIHSNLGSKYVTYLIMVMETPNLDVDKTYITRRFNQFYELHKNLKTELPQLMSNIPFPKKKYFSMGINDSIIEERSRKLEKYLQYIYHQEGVKHTKAFRKFFYEPHLILATSHLMCEDYVQSCQEYQLGYNLQKKLEDINQNVIPTLCGLIEVCRNLEEYKKVEELGTECLDLLQYDIENLYLLPLLQCVIDARKRLRLNCDWLKTKLKECKQNCRYEIESIQTLRQLSVKRY